VTAGLLDLFESTGDARWFTAACALAESTEQEFGDPERGGWFTASGKHERLITRERPAFDGAEPAGSSVALMNAARLAVFTGQQHWREVVERGLSLLWPRIEEQPLSMTEALLAVDFQAGPVREVVLALPSGEDGGAGELRRKLAEGFCPRTVAVIGEPGSTNWTKLSECIPLLRDKLARAGHATAYLCSGQSCREPTSDPEVLARQLRDGGV
jgi:hypothetical protein